MRPPIRAIVLTGMLAVAAACAREPESVRAARALAGRIIPGQASEITFREVSPGDSIDSYLLRSEGGKIVIEGNNALSMAVGLNRYLQDYCHVTVSEYAGHKVDMPAVLPPVPEEVRGRANCPWRFYLNYCTFGYTMPWWTWKEWEHFIDWMALGGVNLPLAITGEEAVWQKVWRRYGLTDGEIRAHFTGPAHLPWQRMCNINAFQGPLPQSWIDGQAALQKRILARERELSMTPVLPSFGGSVPARFKALHPEAAVSEVSRWGGFSEEAHRCWFLSPEDSLFTAIQKDFIAEQERMFGTGHMYGLDPFNEVQPPSWEPEDLAHYGEAFYRSLEAADPEAVWLQMGWFLINDPAHWTQQARDAFLGAIPRGRMLLLDYWADRNPAWEKTGGFGGHDFLTCALLNFGGNTTLSGDLLETGATFDRARVSCPENFKGVGCTLEGFAMTPWFFEYSLSKAWDTGVSADRWIETLADRHTGRADSLARRIWRRMVTEAGPSYRGMNCSSAVAHPRMGGRWRWTTWYRTEARETPAMDLWQEMLSLEAPCTDTYGTDLVNIGRQALGDRFDTAREAFEAAYFSGDIDLARQESALMLELLDDMDALMACRGETDLRVWTEAARSWGTTPAEKDCYERNARTILTVWGPAVNLQDYANRQWAGLIASFYKVRWQMFFEEVLSAMESGRPFDQAAYDKEVEAFQQRWTDPSSTQITYARSQDPVALSRRLADKYRNNLCKYCKMTTFASD